MAEVQIGKSDVANAVDILELVPRVKVIVKVFDMLERSIFHQEAYLAPSLLILTVVYLDLLLPLILSSLESRTCLILDLSGFFRGLLFGTSNVVASVLII